MATPDNPIINIADAPLMDRGHGDSFAAKFGPVGQKLGLTKLGCAVHVVPPGKKAFPRHRHYVVDELVYIVAGEGQYRWGDKTLPLRQGDIVSAPAGTEAHQIINTGRADLHYLAISSGGSVDVIDYPDSGKIAVAAGIKNSDFTTATYTAMGRLAKADYWDGED